MFCIIYLSRCGANYITGLQGINLRRYAGTGGSVINTVIALGSYVKILGGYYAGIIHNIRNSVVIAAVAIVDYQSARGEGFARTHMFCIVGLCGSRAYDITCLQSIHLWSHTGTGGSIIYAVI